MQSSVTQKKVCSVIRVYHLVFVEYVSPVFVEFKANNLIFCSSILGKQILLSIGIYNKKKLIKIFTPLTAILLL